jgi:hypothetical protein
MLGLTLFYFTRRLPHLIPYGSHYCHQVLKKDTLSLRKYKQLQTQGEIFTHPQSKQLGR